MLRIGHSRDIHIFAENRDLILGGVKIPYEKGLLGHSDADALTHALIEAIIGAMGLKDIGTHFPDTDEKYKGVSSLLLLEETKKMMRENKYRLLNADMLIMIEKPKMAPYIDEMKKNLAACLEVEESLLNIKATRGEGVGFVGEEKGVEADAVVLLESYE